MSRNSINNKIMVKLVAIIIVVIINVIALIAVFATVGSAIKDLREDIKTGKVYEKSEEDNNTKDENYLEDSGDIGLDVNINFEMVFKAAIADSNVRKSLILMVFALILLAGAIYILVKLK